MESEQNLHSIASFSLEQEAIDGIENTLESSIRGPVTCKSSESGAQKRRCDKLTVKDAMADAAVTVDVGMEQWSHEAALGWESREVLRHLEVEQEATVLVWSLGRLFHMRQSSLRKYIQYMSNLHLQ